MPDSSQDPIAFVQTITTLFAALGLSSIAGIRAYLPLLALGIASDAGLVQLQDSFKDLGSTAVLFIVAILVVGEFIVDKVPVIDHISDLVHTVIRPISGAVIMAGTANPISQQHPWVAALIGAVLAFAFHGAKAATRPAVSATTAGIGNPIVSIIEDVAAVLVSLLLLFAPIIGFILILLLAVTFLRFVSRIFRKLSGRRSPSLPSPGYAVAGSSGGGANSAASPPRVGGLLGRLGGGRSASSAAGSGGILSANAASVTPYTPSAPAAPAAPAFVSPNTTTVAATNQAPYAPNYSNPIQPQPPTSTPYPAPTQTYPPVYPPPWPAQPPLASPYEDDTPTSPGKYNANA